MKQIKRDQFGIRQVGDAFENFPGKVYPFDPENDASRSAAYCAAHEGSVPVDPMLLTEHWPTHFVGLKSGQEYRYDPESYLSRAVTLLRAIETETAAEPVLTYQI